MWENRPEWLLLQSKQKQQQLWQEAQHHRMLRARRPASVYRRLGYHLGCLLCSVGERLQSRHAMN